MGYKPVEKPQATPLAMRERARRIREVAAGFDDNVSRTLTDLARGLEVEAAQLDAKQKAIGLRGQGPE